MNLMNIVVVASAVMAVANGAGMILMYLRYAQTARNVIMSIRAKESGEVEILDLL